MTTQIQPDPLIAQLIQQIQTMQNPLTAFSANDKKLQTNTTPTDDVNPKTGQPWC